MIAENSHTGSTREPRHLELAALLGRDPRVALPRTLPIETADRLFALAVAEASASELAAAAGDEMYRDGYRREPLASWPFQELVNLVAASRAKLITLDRSIEPQARLHSEIGLLLLDLPAADDGERA